MSSTEELAASLAEAEGQLEAVEAGLTSDPTSQVTFYPLPNRQTVYTLGPLQSLTFAFSGPA